MRVIETCKIKKWVNGKWETVDASGVSGIDLEVTPSSKNPDFLQFKSDGAIYSGKKSCFSSPSAQKDEEEMGAKTKMVRSDLTVFTGLGMALSPKVKAVVSASGTSAATEASTDSTLTFGLEARKRFSVFLRVQRSNMPASRTPPQRRIRT